MLSGLVPLGVDVMRFVKHLKFDLHLFNKPHKLFRSDKELHRYELVVQAMSFGAQVQTK